MKATTTRMRAEKRYRRERIAWLKKNAATILGTALLGIMLSTFAYIFWYRYIPSTIEATEEYCKNYIEYRVVAGDTLDGICNRYFKAYGYDRPCSFEWEVININNLYGRINYLQIGETLELPMIVNNTNNT